jgi:dTDP-4-dehydrorhamnose reductase
MLTDAFVTGGFGLLGLNILLHEPPPYKFRTLIHTKQLNLPNVQLTEMDLGCLHSIEEGLKINTPKVMIHTAGMTNVDGCNNDPDAANFINGILPRNLAKVCCDLGIKFVHISTDHLFDGTERFVCEETSPKPLNAYGYSKALGEEGVLQNNKDALIVRCNFFTWGPSYRCSFSDFIYNNLFNGQSITLVDDVYYTPALAQNLIDTILALLSKDASGIYNVVGSERLSKYEFGMKMANIFNQNSNLIKQGTWSSLGAKAIRPYDMSLSDNKLRNFLGYDLGSSRKNILDLKALMGTKLFDKVKSL